jgi:hypothetical protein
MPPWRCPPLVVGEQYHTPVRHELRHVETCAIAPLRLSRPPMNQVLTCSSGCNSSRQRRQFESVSSELVGACFPSLPAASQSGSDHTARRRLQAWQLTLNPVERSRMRLKLRLALCLNRRDRGPSKPLASKVPANASKSVVQAAGMYSNDPAKTSDRPWRDRGGIADDPPACRG